MNKCLTCGYVFENDERSEYRERLEHFGTPCYMVEYACPICGGEYEETKRCSRCDGNFLEEELFDGICNNCLNDELTFDNMFLFLLDDEDIFKDFVEKSVVKCLLYGNDQKDLLIALSGFFAHFESKDFESGTKTFYNICKNYITDNNNDFAKTEYAEWLNEKSEVNK